MSERISRVEDESKDIIMGRNSNRESNNIINISNGNENVKNEINMINLKLGNLNKDVNEIKTITSIKINKNT